MNHKLETRAGGFDWLARWRQMYDDERAQAEALAPAGADHWQGRAARFAASAQRTPQPDPFMQALAPLLRPTDHVLDVGAGAGRYVPFLASQTARVSAVEPSEAMREHLMQRIAEENVENVEVVPHAWPLATDLRADVAFAAHVVYSVREIGPFLQAMNASADRLCVLLAMVRHINALVSPFWERIHGEPRHLLPAALEVYNVLFQLGYSATLELIPARPVVYADLNEALTDIRQRLRLNPESGRDAELRTAIEELLICNDDGSIAPPNQPRYAAVIAWRPGDMLV
jgi:SAM-dependent methyltransferase